MNNKKEDIEISIGNLRKNFGNLTAVDDLSLDIFRGEILGFLGPNGAGKTTTINMICGLIPPTSGTISFSGNGSGHERGIKERIGVCPQENVFWPKLTCREQLIFMAEMYDIRRKEARAMADQLLGLLGLEEKAGVQARKLSGGMKRRLSIGLALIHDPEILVLDEPEAGLDPQSRILVRDFILELSGRKTIIVTTHNMDEADRLSDRVAIIDYGKLLLTDTPENLKRSIGEGDILECTFEEMTTDGKERLTPELLQHYASVSFRNNTLVIRSKNLIGNIGMVTEKIKSLDFTIKEITLRENTLEDVFIHLTGRKLRQ